MNNVSEAKLRPFDGRSANVGDEVRFLRSTRAAGRIVDIDLKAGDDAVVVRWSTGAVSTYCCDGSVYGHPVLALPPIDPMDEVDPSPGNVNKLTRRQVGDGFRIPTHDEPRDDRAEYWHRGDKKWVQCAKGSWPHYGAGNTYRVSIAPAMVPLEQSDIVLGKTVVRKLYTTRCDLVIGTSDLGVFLASRDAVIQWDALRDHLISFDHGVTWQKAEKEGGVK